MNWYTSIYHPTILAFYLPYLRSHLHVLKNKYDWDEQERLQSLRKTSAWLSWFRTLIYVRSFSITLVFSNVSPKAFGLLLKKKNKKNSTSILFLWRLRGNGHVQWELQGFLSWWSENPWLTLVSLGRPKLSPSHCCLEPYRIKPAFVWKSWIHPWCAIALAAPGLTLK